MNTDLPSSDWPAYRRHAYTAAMICFPISLAAAAFGWTVIGMHAAMAGIAVLLMIGIERQIEDNRRGIVRSWSWIGAPVLRREDRPALFRVIHAGMLATYLISLAVIAWGVAAMAALRAG